MHIAPFVCNICTFHFTFEDFVYRNTITGSEASATVKSLQHFLNPTEIQRNRGI